MAGDMHGRGVHSKGACMAGGMYGRGYMAGTVHDRGAYVARGHAWQGGCAWQGACVAGACMAWALCMQERWLCTRGYASYWNAFLCQVDLHRPVATNPWINNTKLRMHSSRMCTTRSSSHWGEGLHQAPPPRAGTPQDQNPQEQAPPQSSTPLGQALPRDQTLPVDRHTPVNILPCPKLRLRAVY